MRLKDKTALITGAGRGQGFAEAVALLASGSTVIATDLAESCPAPLAKAGDSLPGTLVYAQLDIANEAEWTGLASYLKKTYKRVDGLVNNAGIPFRGRIGEIKREDWEVVEYLRAFLFGRLVQDGIAQRWLAEHCPN